MLKFLHTADWQIGRQFGRFDADDGALLAGARLDAVSRIAALATERQVDAVLVAGDIFDTQTISDKLLRRTFQAMTGYRGTWLMLPGNHDAALADGIWRRAQEFGLLTDRVILLDRAEPYLMPESSCAVLPAPLTQRQTMQDMTAWFDSAETPEDYFRIGVAHGSVAGRMPDLPGATTNPIDPERATRARLDYLALGDWHGCLQINERTWYSGTPEADRFRANDPGYVLEVCIDQPSDTPDVSIQRVGQFTWHRIEMVLTSADGLQLLRDRCQSLDASAVVRIKLAGLLSWQHTQELQDILSRLQAGVAALDSDTTALGLLPDEDEMTQLVPDGYLGEVMASLRQEVAVEDTADPVKRQALTILAEAVAARHDKGQGR